MPRASSALTYGRVRSRPYVWNRRNIRQTWRESMATRPPAPSATVHGLPAARKWMNAATASGYDSSIAKLATSRVPYGLGTGSATIAGWSATSLRKRSSGT